MRSIVVICVLLCSPEAAAPVAAQSYNYYQQERLRIEQERLEMERERHRRPFHPPDYIDSNPTSDQLRRNRQERREEERLEMERERHDAWRRQQYGR